MIIEKNLEVVVRKKEALLIVSLEVVVRKKEALLIVSSNNIFLGSSSVEKKKQYKKPRRLI